MCVSESLERARPFALPDVTTSNPDKHDCERGWGNTLPRVSRPSLPLNWAGGAWVRCKRRAARTTVRLSKRIGSGAALR